MGKEAEFYETLSDEEVMKTCLETLKSFLKKQNIELPKLQRIIR